MKVQLFLPATIVVSVALVGIMKIRKREHEKEEKKDRFENIKLRVTYDVLAEYQKEKAELQNLLDKAQSALKALESEVNMVRIKADERKGEVDVCLGSKKSERDGLATVEADYNNLKAETEKEETSWNAEVETLKKQLAARSSVCDFLVKGSQAASKLCGDEVIVEGPKQDESKKEASKQEEPKAVAPKEGEAKGEAQKEGEAKAEAPKKEEPKAEAPKEGEAKAEAPKKEEPKAEASKKR